jgi:hypothetical protein
VPDALTARTRFEPSAIAWSPARDRFIIASDDTGQGKTSEHVPWLFTMDTTGRVDAEPLIVAGIPAFSDLEALTPGPDASFYLLASQSRSRKGKRPAARQLFAQIAVDASGARVLASTSLADQLDAAGNQFLTTLGLTDTDDLDLEGLTSTRAGGLLFGVKQPVASDGAAIWHLADPAALLAGNLAGAGLTRWGAVPLTVQAAGAPRPAGIADLLELADGTLLIASTASGADPTTQDGALWLATGKDGLASPRLLRTFPGLKPEGIALRHDGAALVVVFDTSAAPGLWMELPWPAP